MNSYCDRERKLCTTKSTKNFLSNTTVTQQLGNDPSDNFSKAVIVRGSYFEVSRKAQARFFSVFLTIHVFDSSKKFAFIFCSTLIILTGHRTLIILLLQMCGNINIAISLFR